jgi:hypothetical protein
MRASLKGGVFLEPLEAKGAQFESERVGAAGNCVDLTA